MKRLFGFMALLMITSGLFSQTWNYVNSTGTSFILFGMSFPTGQSDIGYACGMQYTYNADGVIVKTIDGGENWSEILPVSGTIDGLQGIWFISETVGFAGGWNDYFIKTTDGGTTWTQINQGANVWYYKDVEFWDANNGLAIASMNSSSDQSVFITSDGGNTWTPCASGMDNASIMGISYADATTIYAVGTDAKVYKSTDGGNNWSNIYTLPALLFGVEFADTNFGVVGGEEKIFATNDGGTTWTTFTTGYENFYATHALSNGTAYVGGTDENIYVTTDYGSTWTIEHNGTGSSHLYRIREVESSALFACGSQGTIITREAQFGANFEASTDSICVGGTVNFSDLSIGSIVSWNWTFEGGTPSTSTDQNPSVVYNTVGSYDVTLEISDGTNTDTYTVTDMIHVVEITAAPDMPTGETSMCAGESSEYETAQVAGAESYYWEVSPGDAGTISGNGYTATFTSDDSFTGDYFIAVRTSNMCGYSDWSDSLLCSLSLTPEAFVLSEGGGYCEGEQGIEITLDGSETGVDYELFLESISTGIIVAGTGSEINFGYQTDEGIYTVNGYTSTCEQLMVGTPYIYILYTPEQGNIPEGDDMVCAGSTTSYTTDAIPNAESIIWTLLPEEAGDIEGEGTEIDVVWNIDFEGVAILTTTGSNSCGNGIESDPLEISVEILPQPVIVGPELVCDEEEAEYSTDEVAGYTYDWNVTGGEIISGMGTSSINIMWGEPGLGVVSVTETSANMCEGTSDEYTVTIDDCTYQDEIKNQNINIYPNPANRVVYISFESLVNSEYSIVISNIMGQDIKFIKGKGNGSLSTYEVDIMGMPSGQYIISISSDNNPVITRMSLIIE